jgi:hypothetical protein
VRSHWWIALLAASVLAGAVPRPSWAGALERFQKPHRPPDDDRDKRSSSSESSSSSADDHEEYDDYGSYDDYESDEEASGGDGTWALFFFCAIPPLTFGCFLPAHRPAREVYGSDRLYLEPVGQRTSDGLVTERAYLPEDREEFRWGEISFLGFRAFNEPVVYSHDLDLTFWLGPVLAHLSWEHFYEQLEDTDDWDHLNLFGGHLGANVLGPFVDFLELYLLAGAIVLHYGDEWIPAFDAGLDLRAYPAEPLAMHASANLSVFEHGPVLLDARLGAGVALGPIEIRAGPRWLYQGEAQGFWGPAVTLAGRF